MDSTFEEPVLPPLSRLETPISIDDIMNKCPEFCIRSNGIDEEHETETDITLAYQPEVLEPYRLFEITEPDSEDESDDLKKSFPFFRKRMECVTKDGKILKKIERCGAGNIVGDMEKVVVYIHYAVYYDFSENPFDLSRARQKKPEVYRLGHDLLVEGMEIAIRSMKKQERSKFIIEPEYAFGERGVPPRIPPNATLLYDIELIDFNQNEAMAIRFDDEQRLPKTFEELMKWAKDLRQQGNKSFELEKNLNQAIGLYRKAILLITMKIHFQNAEQEGIAREELLKLYCNLAVCYWKKKSYKQVCSVYNDAVRDCPNTANINPKLLCNSGRALRMLGNFEEASKRLKKANSLCPGNESILKELNELTIKKKDYQESDKKMCQNMFGFRKVNQSDEDEKNYEQFLNIVDEEFQNLVIGQINEFIKSDKSSWKFSFGSTAAEKEFIRNESSKKNLSFRETKNGENVTYILTKK